MESACMKNSSELHINDLPNEVLQHIFVFLPQLKYRKNLSLVRQRWNDLAFDYRYMSHVMLKLIFNMSTIRSLPKISRDYRYAFICCNPRYIPEYPTGYPLRDFFCSVHSEVYSADYLWYESRCKKEKLRNEYTRTIHVEPERARKLVNETLPVLETLEELIVADLSTVDIIHLAPNIRTLEIIGESTSELPTIIQKLPLEHLRVRVEYLNNSINFLTNCTETSKLTSVDLTVLVDTFDEINLKTLCQSCPVLTKLLIDVTKIASLQCLTRLTNLKVLGFKNFNQDLLENSDFCLPNVAIIEFTHPTTLVFGNSMQIMFPNVYYLKFDYDKFDRITGNINDGFPQLRRLELERFKDKDLSDLLQGLPNLIEIIIRESTLSDLHLPPMGLQQLTLKDSEFLVTKRMEKSFPKLKFVNLFGTSTRFINTEKLPSGCVVRRYIRDSSKDIFDILF